MKNTNNSITEHETAPATPEPVNRVQEIKREMGTELVSTVATPEPTPSTTEVSKKRFGRIKTLKREELGQALVQEITLRLPSDWFQLYPINTEADEGVVYMVKLLHPDDKEEKMYIVETDVVVAALNLAEKGDFTFAMLTPVENNYTCNVRTYELYPWVDRVGTFGFWPVMVGMEESTLSMNTYLQKKSDINDTHGKWVRHAGKITIPAPPQAVMPDPKWPKEVLNGQIDTLILRAYKGRIIKALESDEARWAAGLI
jgi:hypothetical protein